MLVRRNVSVSTDKKIFDKIIISGGGWSINQQFKIEDAAYRRFNLAFSFHILQHKAGGPATWCHQKIGNRNIKKCRNFYGKILSVGLVKIEMQRKADINYQANIKRYSTNQLGENWTELRESQNSSGITLSWLILRYTLPSRFPGRLKTEAAGACAPLLAVWMWLPSKKEKQWGENLLPVRHNNKVLSLTW